MQLSPLQVSDDHRKALSIITYVGLTLSLIGEVLTVGCYVLLIGLNTEQAHLHTNLASALVMAQIFFLSGMSAAGHQVKILIYSPARYICLALGVAVIPSGARFPFPLENKRNLPVFFPRIDRALSIVKSGSQKNVKVMSILFFLET